MNEDDKIFKESINSFDKLLNAAINVSEKSGGINTTTIKIEATKIYTRLVLSALTIQRILPQNSINKSKLWDFPSIAILARSYIETTHRYFYLAESDLDEDDEQFRLKLHYYHLNSEKSRLYSHMPEHEINKEFKDALPKAKKELLDLPFYSTLSKYYKDKVKSGNADMHFSDEIMAKRCNLIDEHFEFYYRLLSNHAHGSPFATTSQSNTRGRGLKNDTEMFYITLTVNILNKYLSAVIINQVSLFSLQSKCNIALKTSTEIHDKSNI